MPPRALVVRSGERSVLEAGAPAGIEVVERVSHTIEAVEPPTGALAAPAALAVFTSRSGVTHGLSGPSGAALRRCLAGARVVAVGRATAGALEAAGLPPSVVAGGSAEAVLTAIPSALRGVRVLLPCGDDASPELAEALRRRGAEVVRCVVYRKRPHPPDAALGAEIVDRPFAAYCATSPAAARWLFGSAGPRGVERLKATPAVALGPSTRAWLAEHGVEQIAVTEEAGFGPALDLLETLATGRAGK